MDDACMLDWLAATLRGDVQLSALAAIAPDELIVFAKDQGVLPLLESQLRATGHFASVPPALQQALVPHVRQAVVQDLFRTGEMRKLASALQVAGIRALLLKGNAVAQWLYPESHLRPSSDIDLLLPSRADAERAACAAQPLGYALGFHPNSSNFEMAAQRVVDGVSRSELDLHCRLLNSAAYADIFSFAELWQESIALPALGEGLRGLSPRHALAHACLNRALDMQIGVPDQLKLLYDIHLMVERMHEADWAEVLAMAQHKAINGVCLRSIVDARTRFHSDVPAHVMEALQRNADAESIDWHRLDDWRYMQWQNLKALPTTGARLRWLWQRLAPSSSHLRHMYGEGSWLGLMGHRLWRGVGRLHAKR
jgi:hypothetical protein